MSKKKQNEVLQKPVHVAILKPSHVQKLAKAGQLPDRLLTKTTPKPSKLPDGSPPPPPPKPLPAYRKVAAEASSQRRKTMIRTHLRVVHEGIEVQGEKPPCDECVTAACCHVFMVNITQDEYDSGLYGDYAVKLTAQDAENLGVGSVARLATMHAPSIHLVQEDQHYLEGPIGTPCPFLGDDNLCTIYEKRPITCRSYSCVGDDRITQEMRDGTVNLEIAILDNILDPNNADNNK